MMDGSAMASEGGALRFRPSRKRSSVALKQLVFDVRQAGLITLAGLVVVLLVSSRLRYSVFHPLFWKPLQAEALDASVLAREKLARDFLTRDPKRLSAKLSKIETPEILAERRARFTRFKFRGHLSIAEAKILLDSLGEPPRHQFCAAIQSSFREEPYALRTLASLLSAQNHPQAEPALVGVMDYNQSSDVRAAMNKAHPNLVILSRDDLVNDYALPGLVREYQKFRRRADEVKSSRQKWMTQQRIDYALALTFCLVNNCARCLILENDALLSQDATVKALESARWLDAKQPHWGLLRLFRSDFFSGWERKNQDVLTLTGITIVGGILGCIYAYKKSKRPIVWTFFGALWAIGLVMMLGKQHLPIVGRRHPIGLSRADEDGSVSSIAHTYPRHVVASLVDWLGAPCCLGLREPIDLFVGELLWNQKASFWELVPNRAEHIGVRTTFQGSNLRKGLSGFSNKAWHANYVQSDTFDMDSTPF